MQSNLLIYTDLDGSLLDHFSYSFAAAQPLLQRLEESGVAVIPVTSKTCSELVSLRVDLKNRHPFIVENGAAVFIPINYFPLIPEGVEVTNNYYVHCFSKPRAFWQALLHKFSADYGADFITFAEAGAEGIMDMTGLDLCSAQQANERQFSEPVFWKGSADRKQRFILDLKAAGATVLQGGRFLHITGDCDKGKALNWLSQEYRRQFSDYQFKTLAAGDSQNDIAMLEVADIAVLIRSPVHSLPELHHSNFYSTQAVGPKGWVEGVSRIAQDFLTSVDSSTSNNRIL